MRNTQTVIRRVTRQDRSMPMGMDEDAVSILIAFGGGALFGALMMYVLDPEMGRRRRALARDQVVHARHVAGDVADGARGQTQHLRNQAYGTVAEMRG